MCGGQCNPAISSLAAFRRQRSRRNPAQELQHNLASLIPHTADDQQRMVAAIGCHPPGKKFSSGNNRAITAGAIDACPEAPSNRDRTVCWLHRCDGAAGQLVLQRNHWLVQRHPEWPLARQLRPAMGAGQRNDVSQRFSLLSTSSSGSTCSELVHTLCEHLDAFQCGRALHDCRCWRQNSHTSRRQDQTRIDASSLQHSLPV